MAGSLLLLSKNRADIDTFRETADSLSQDTIEIYGPHFKHIEVHQPSAGALLIEFRHDDTQKYLLLEDGSWICYEGSIFALEETKKLDCTDLWSCYKKYGSEIGNHLDGHYVLKIYDHQKMTHYVITDYIKNKTNFICETDDLLLFTPFAATSGAIRTPELDPYALNEFMWRYYIMSYRSILQGVTKLRPASVYTIQNDEWSQEPYADTPKEFSSMNFDSIVEKTVESMKESARLIDSSFDSSCLDFTLGQDTRQVVSSFKSVNADFVTSTFGASDFTEVVEAKNRANKHKFPHHNIQLESDYVNDPWSHFYKAVLLGSCEEPGHLLGRIMYMREAQSKLGSAVVNGVEGQFYKNGLWDELYAVNLYREPKRFNVDLFMSLRALSKNYPSDFFSEEYLIIKANSKNYVRSIADEAIKDHLDSPVCMQVDRFDIYNWLNYGTTSNNGGNMVSNSISMLLLRRNLEFAISVPVKYKFHLSKYQRAVVYALAPELAKDKNDWAGVNMVPKKGLDWVPFYGKYFWAQSERLRKKVGTKMGFKKKTHLQKAWDYGPIFKKLFLSDEMQDMIKNPDGLEVYLDKARWDEFADGYHKLTPSINRYEQLFKLMSVVSLYRSAQKFVKK